jgi:hypothetical protein
VVLKKLSELGCENFSVGRKSKRSNIKFNEYESPEMSLWNTILFRTCIETTELHPFGFEDNPFSLFLQSFQLSEKITILDGIASWPRK